jgi:hypothetical protein
VITKGKKKVPVKILELKSVHKAEVSEDTHLHFQVSDKVVDVHGDTTQKAKMLEIMIANSVDMDQSEEISNVEGCEPMTWKPMVL